MAYNTPKKLGSVVTQVFTGNGTYTPTTGMVSCVIECVGGGGAGGSALSAPGGYWLSAAGGGGGGYARKYSTSAAIGASQTVTVGAGGTPGAAGLNPGGNGGDTSVGTICIGKGGTGGGGNDGSAYPAGGAGGVAGTGDLTFPGGPGMGGPIDVYTNTTKYSAGGNSYFGSGASYGVILSQGDGSAGSVYGGGGSGATSRNGGGNQAGGAGAAGVVIITEYIQ